MNLWDSMITEVRAMELYFSKLESKNVNNT